jgi:hypothetical protein
MRIFNRAHGPWFIFVLLATAFAGWLYIGNFAPENLPAGLRLPLPFVQKPSEHRSVGGTPLGLIFGAISLSIFVFAALLGVRKKVVLWRIGNLQRWLRAHIWLTLLTIPLVILHSGFRFGGPMTTFLLILYAIVMVSGIYGLALQHQLPRIMKERLPAETVYEQIPHIRAQLFAAATKMRDSFKPNPPAKTDAGAPVASPTKAVTTGSTPMASTTADLSTPTARAKTAVGSTITAATISASATEVAAAVADHGPATASPATTSTAPATTAAIPVVKPPETMGTATARVSEGSPVPSGKEAAPPVAPIADRGPLSTAPATAKVKPQPTAAATAKPPATPAAAQDPESEAALVEFLEQQILPYLSAQRGDRFDLGDSRYSEDLFRFVKLRVAEVYRARVEEIQAWCDERRMLDLQVKLQHWLHGWLFVHAPISFLLIMLTAWHAYVTLFSY